MQPPADVNAALRRLPKVDDVLGTSSVRELLARAPRWAVVSAVREEIDRLRAQLLAGGNQVDVDSGAIAKRVDGLTRASLRPVINATGVVLHTNLGRAPLASAAIE